MSDVSDRDTSLLSQALPRDEATSDQGLLGSRLLRLCAAWFFWGARDVAFMWPWAYQFSFLAASPVGFRDPPPGRLREQRGSEHKGTANSKHACTNKGGHALGESAGQNGLPPKRHHIFLSFFSCLGAATCDSPPHHLSHFLVKRQPLSH